MGAGGLQALIKSGFPMHGKRVVVAGSGPLLLAVAHYLRSHGAKVLAIAEQTSRAAVSRFGLGLFAKPSKLLQAAQFWGVPYRTSTWPIRAQGHGQLESVTLSSRGRIVTLACDYLACGFGLVPNVELAVLLGCRLNDTGVAVDEEQRTSVPGVYAAGEITGIGGLDLSLVEGEIAGYSAAGQAEPARRLHRKRKAERRFAAQMERAFALRPELRQLPHDDTLVCRCEDVAYARVRQFSGWREAKLQTRCGMGSCQGRVCGSAAEFLLGWKSESVRPPIFPARIGSLTPRAVDRKPHDSPST
jgi:NADPH-dependent 2,4-dienoyl-CoA reductase/sulfur reductase-like enzyme